MDKRQPPQHPPLLQRTIKSNGLLLFSSFSTLMFVIGATVYFFKELIEEYYDLGTKWRLAYFTLACALSIFAFIWTVFVVIHNLWKCYLYLTAPEPVSSAADVTNDSELQSSEPTSGALDTNPPADPTSPSQKLDPSGEGDSSLYFTEEGQDVRADRIKVEINPKRLSDLAPDIPFVDAATPRLQREGLQQEKPKEIEMQTFKKASPKKRGMPSIDTTAASEAIETLETMDDTL